MKLSQLLEDRDKSVKVTPRKGVINGMMIDKHYGNVNGFFECTNLNLTTLKNGPTKVTNHFDCSNNLLTSLEFGPEEVGSYVYCGENQLKTLEFCPKIVGGHFNCYKGQLTTIEHAPMKLGGYFSCGRNNLTSLEGVGRKYLKVINEFSKGNGTFSALINPFKSHLLGLVLIKNCTVIQFDNREVRDILTKHLQGDVMEAREELITAGFKEYAKL